MALTAQPQRGGTSWVDTLQNSEDRNISLELLYLKAINSVDSAKQEGRLTDEEADNLLSGITAIMVEAKSNMMVSPVIERSLRIPTHGRKRWSNIFTSFSDR